MAYLSPSIALVAQNGHISYGIKEFVVKKEAEDIDNLPIDVAMGSKALAIDTSNVFIFDGETWVKQTSYSPSPTGEVNLNQIVQDPDTLMIVDNGNAETPFENEEE